VDWRWENKDVENLGAARIVVRKIRMGIEILSD